MQGYLIRNKATGALISRGGDIFDPKGTVMTYPFDTVKGARNLLGRLVKTTLQNSDLEIVTVDVNYALGQTISN